MYKISRIPSLLTALTFLLPAASGQATPNAGNFAR